MRILVTGGAGFIGSHVAEAFARLGHDVLALDNLATGRHENVPDGVRFVQMDIGSSDTVDLVREFRPEVVNHHAAHADVRRSVDDPMGDARANVLGMISLVHAAGQAGTRRFIFASSGGAMYGEPVATPCAEDHPIAPMCPYGAAKAAGEVYLETFARIYGAECTIFRYPNVYGPRQHVHAEESRVVAIFSRLMLADRQPTIFGTGEQQRDFVYVGDVVAANVRALEGGSAGTFNLGTGVGLSVNDLYRHLKRLTGYRGGVQYAPARPGEVFRMALDASRARAVLGWEPKTHLEDGLRATVEWARGTIPTARAKN